MRRLIFGSSFALINLVKSVFASIRRTQERPQKITFSSSFVSSDDDVRVGSENGGGCFDWATFTEHPA